jgi:hypothetical protein
VKATVIAWEKRGYWIKADRFMAEWAWVERMRIKVEAALERSEDWPDPKLHHQLEQHLGDVTLPARMRNKRPWIGEGKSAEQNP